MADQCTITTLDEADASDRLMSQCTSSFQGTVVAACPPSHIVGCYTSDKAGSYDYEVCYYMGKLDLDGVESTCKSNGGTWKKTQ